MAAGEQTIWNESYQAGADLSTKQFFLVKLDTTEGRVVLCAAATDKPVGILQNAPSAVGRPAEVMKMGTSKAQVEATTDIAIGDWLGPHTDGRLIKKTADKDVVCAQAKQVATSVTGDVIEVDVFPPFYLGA